MHFRVESRTPTTFNRKLYITTVINIFQPLPISCHKEFHIRCYIGLELNILQCWKKTHSRRWPKKFPEAFCIRFYAFNIKWIKWS